MEFSVTVFNEMIYLMAFSRFYESSKFNALFEVGMKFEVVKYRLMLLIPLNVFDQSVYIKLVKLLENLIVSKLSSDFKTVSLSLCAHETSILTEYLYGILESNQTVLFLSSWHQKDFETAGQHSLLKNDYIWCERRNIVL